MGNLTDKSGPIRRDGCGGGGSAAPGPSGEPVRLLDGRFGPYVTDGTLNASIPRGTTVEEVTLDLALDLLEQRAKKGGTKRKAKSKSAKKRPNKSTKKKKASRTKSGA